jgi:hypothetical protein
MELRSARREGRHVQVTTWATLRTALKAAVQTAAADAGAVSAGVAWGDEQRPTAKLLILLDIVSAVSLHDRDTFTVALGGASTSWAFSSLYNVNLQVRCESTNNGPATDALFALEALRASLHRPGLVIAGAALEWPETQTVSRVSFVSDGRVVSSYSFEVSVRAVLDFAPGDEVGGTVLEVLVEGESTTPDFDTPAATDLDVVAPT